MNLYADDKITISKIKEEDRYKVLELFSSNTFNCDRETGYLRPTSSEFMDIMMDVISGKDDESLILVLKKEYNVIGYESMYIQYDRLIIGHIAVEESERGKGYGELLTKIAIQIAENENRDVSLYCNHKNSYFEKLDLKTNDGIHYLYKRQGIKISNFPIFFVDCKEYEAIVEEKAKKELEEYEKFLEQWNRVFS